MVPDVPRERLQSPSFTVPVPIADAALSPAPMMIFVSEESPSASAIASFIQPID